MLHNHHNHHTHPGQQPHRTVVVPANPSPQLHHHHRHPSQVPHIPPQPIPPVGAVPYPHQVVHGHPNPPHRPIQQAPAGYHAFFSQIQTGHGHHAHQHPTPPPAGMGGPR